ncbi:tyrosine-type recombinase/integrase [Clostridium sp. WILCCON 0269]|uniref:Tyrosine-type recombinase/integrase n=1 Tax=Candidatus Clostridium eludens TaxID=3381663 RepID=A0ABW8SEG8_9CLOT
MDYNVTYRKKDKGVQFIISYKDANGKWKQKSRQGFKTQKEAKPIINKIIQQLEKDLDLQSKLNSKLQGITLKEYHKAFVEHQKLYKEHNTIEHYKATFNAFSELDNYEMIKIKNYDIQRCVDELVKNDYSESSIKGFLSSLHYAFNYAIKKEKIMLENPVKDIDFKVEKNKKTKIALTKKQTEDLLSRIKNKKLHLISMVAAKCGLRISEILGLTWNDIDTKNSMLIVNKQWKIDKKGQYNFGEVKAKNSIRKVPIPKDLMKEFKIYRSEKKILDLSDKIFHYSSREAMSATLCNTYRNAGYKISVHELRHTYATMLIANGLDFKTTANILGHDVKQTMDTYAHVTDDMINNARRIINEIF